MTKKFDCIIIGAGMSGLATGIRLSMFNKKVLIIEKHNIPGGLNSYYSRGKRKFDVGLHALTNFISPQEKGKPFNKLLKQLRIPYEDFKLTPQNYSLIHFPEYKLTFSNDIRLLTEEIAKKFPHEIDHFINLLEYIKNFNELNLTNKTFMAREVVSTFIKEKALLEMLFAPLLIYGSAWENDMDFTQFVIMFKSIYFEGFSRPEGGVRTIINLLLQKLKSFDTEIKYKTEVTKIITKDNKTVGIEINHNEMIECDHIISSMGLPETFSIVDELKNFKKPQVGLLSFCETIIMANKKPQELGIDATIIFYNNRPNYLYERPDTFIDTKSAVLCFPNNFAYDIFHDDYDEGVFRVTNIANFNLWNNLKEKNIDSKKYDRQKEDVFQNAKKTLFTCGLNDDFQVLYKDIFTPTTIKDYTCHLAGTVYGSTEKSRDGKTPIQNLFICGTDQGFLGIVGSMLSGISMANLHILQSDFK